MSEDTYRTVAGEGRSRLEARGSRFLGVVAPAPDVETAEATIEDLEDDHPDATHVIPAYRVRADPLREYASDRGEPNGSAGTPMLSVLQGEDLENVVAVVVRHYGGTNLGIGGLVSAYSDAVGAAIEDAGTEHRRPHEALALTVEYDDSGTVRSILESEGVDFEADYDAAVRFEVRVPAAEADALRERLRSATGDRIEMAAVPDADQKG